MASNLILFNYLDILKTGIRIDSLVPSSFMLILEQCMFNYCQEYLSSLLDCSYRKVL